MRQVVLASVEGTAAGCSAVAPASAVAGESAGIGVPAVAEGFAAAEADASFLSAGSADEDDFPGCPAWALRCFE